MGLSGDGCQREKSGDPGVPTGSDSLPGGLQQLDGRLHILNSLRRLRLLDNAVVFSLHGFHGGVGSDRAEMIKLPPLTRCHVEKPRNESSWAASMPLGLCHHWGFNMGVSGCMSMQNGYSESKREGKRES